MSWDEEDDTTARKVAKSLELQKILERIKKDTRLVAANRVDARKALVSYNLTAS